MDISEKFKNLGAAGNESMKQSTGNFIYLGREYYGKLHTPLSAIASQQGSPNKDTMHRTKHCMAYMATQEGIVLT